MESPECSFIMPMCTKAPGYLWAGTYSVHINVSVSRSIMVPPASSEMYFKLCVVSSLDDVWMCVVELSLENRTG